jgi:hypothetical protein
LFSIGWIVAGAGTKRPIADGGVVPTPFTRKLRGVVEYSPEEYVISALAGTPVRELVGALAENGQFLPFGRDHHHAPRSRRREGPAVPRRRPCPEINRVNGKRFCECPGRCLS